MTPTGVSERVIAKKRSQTPYTHTNTLQAVRPWSSFVRAEDANHPNLSTFPMRQQMTLPLLPTYHILPKLHCCIIQRSISFYREPKRCGLWPCQKHNNNNKKKKSDIFGFRLCETCEDAVAAFRPASDERRDRGIHARENFIIRGYWSEEGLEVEHDSMDVTFRTSTQKL